MKRITSRVGFFADWYVMGGVSYPKGKKKYIIVKFGMVNMNNIEM